MGAGRAHGFGNQRAGQMRRMRHAGGVVLERIHIAQLGAHAVSHHQTIGGGTIVVGSGKALQMQTAAAATGQYHRFGVHDQQFAPLQIIEHRAHAAAVLIGEQFDGGAAVELGDAALELDGFAQHAHHFQSGEIAVTQHTRNAGAAGALALQAAVVVGAGCQVEGHSQADQPADGGGAVGDHLRHQILFGCVVAAFEGVFKMLLQAVFFAHSGLNAALGHHGVAVADAQFVGHNHACAGLGGGERRCGTGTAAADHQHIGVHRHGTG